MGSLRRWTAAAAVLTTLALYFWSTTGAAEDVDIADVLTPLAEPTPTDTPLPVFQLPQLSFDFFDRVKTAAVRHVTLFSSRVEALSELALRFGELPPAEQSRLLDETSNNSRSPFCEPLNFALSDTINYDFAAGLYKLGALTGDSAWDEAGDAAARFVRDFFIIPADGRFSPFYSLTDGVAAHYLRTGDQRSREALELIIKNGSYISSNISNSENQTLLSAERSRETAYAVIAYLNAERVGLDPSSRLDYLVSASMQHVTQWIETLRDPSNTPSWRGVSSREPFVKSFMTALTATALLRYRNSHPDSALNPAIVSGLTELFDLLVEKAWVEEAHAFRYFDRVLPDENPVWQDDRRNDALGITPQVDLNGLMAGAFYRLAQALAESDRGDDARRFIARAEILLAKAASSAYMDGNFAKQLSQQLFTLDPNSVSVGGIITPAPEETPEPEISPSPTASPTPETRETPAAEEPTPTPTPLSEEERRIEP